METGFVYNPKIGAYTQRIGAVELIQRANERQIAAFVNGRCIETFTNRKTAKAYANEVSTHI